MNVEAFLEPQSEVSQGKKDWAYLDPNTRRMLKAAFFKKFSRVGSNPVQRGLSNRKITQFME